MQPFRKIAQKPYWNKSKTKSSEAPQKHTMKCQPKRRLGTVTLVASKQALPKKGETRRYYRVWDIAGPTGILPIGISTFWRWIAKGYLPEPIRLGARCSMWDAAEIDSAIKMIDKKSKRKK